MIRKPTLRPSRPHFSSGPCVKRPGWSVEALAEALVGRSHRAASSVAKLRDVIDRSRAILGIPEEYRVGVVPGSNTGAFEGALWSLLGARGVDVLAWESFGKGWVTDVVRQLGVDDARVLEADYGELPDLDGVDGDRDVVFTWNGTTSGVRLPHGDWIAEDRRGLTLCDATSAVFGMDLPWTKLDAITWSWQKVLGGEAAHGMLALSPRAVERLESHTPAWPLPKIFRLTRGGQLIEGIFRGEPINTPSMLCVEDALDGLRWAEEIGGLEATIARAEANLAVLTAWVEKTDWIEFLARAPETRSCTSVCFKAVDPRFLELGPGERAGAVQEVATQLEREEIAYDIGSYRDAPAGLRIWAGATVEREDLAALTPWIDWAWARGKAW